MYAWLETLEGVSAWLRPRPLVSMAAVLGVLALLAGGLALLLRLNPSRTELCRKALHVAMGLVTLSFPWIFERVWPVWLMAGVAAGGLALLRLPLARATPLGRVLHGVKRDSWGEICFPLSVALLFTLMEQDAVRYVVPLLVLTLADAMAALVGLRYGTVGLRVGNSQKSVEGWVAFFVVAFFAVHVPLLMGTPIGRAESLLIALTIALLVSEFELISSRGLDNLFVPLGTFALLQVYIGLPADALLYRFLVAVALLGFVALWRRRSPLDHAALIAAALFGYYALMIGGWRALIPPLVLLLVPALFWPRRERPAEQHVSVVLLGTLLPAAILLVHTRNPDPLWLHLYGLCFAHHVGGTIVAYTTRRKHSTAHIKLRTAAVGVFTAAFLAAGFSSGLLLTAEPSHEHAVWKMPATTAAFAAASVAAFTAALPHLLRRADPHRSIRFASNAILTVICVLLASTR